MLLKTDDYIIDLVQRAYNFVWDNFGITKGFIAMLRRFTCAFLVFIVTDIDMLFRVIWAAYYICTAYRSYNTWHVKQVKGQFKEINKLALQSRQGSMQRVKLYFIFPVFMILIWYLLRLESYTYAIIAFSELSATYLVTILIRDREPTESSFSFSGVT